jgi:hypothetical protein
MLVAIVGACNSSQPTPQRPSSAVQASGGPASSSVPPAHLSIVVDDRHRQPVIQSSSWFLSVLDTNAVVIATWQIAAEPISHDLQPGLYRLQAWTVYESDEVECTTPPGQAIQSCSAATTPPTATCALDVSLTPGLDARVTYRVFDGETCQLLPSR